MADAFDDTFLQGTTRFIMPSTATGIDYAVHVSLPLAYEAGAVRYPVALVLDANYCVGTAVETVRLQAATGEVDELIVVCIGTPGGVETHSRRRVRDLTPGAAFMSTKPDHATVKLMRQRMEKGGLHESEVFGGSAAFAEFLKSELLPHLEREYRIDLNNVGLIGHSAAGIFGFELLLGGMSWAKKLGLGTFSVDWFEPERLEALVRAFESAPPTEGKVQVLIGGAELTDEGLGPSVRESLALLERLRAAAPGVSFSIRVLEDETHTSLLAIVIASSVRALWSTGLSYTQAVHARQNATKDG